VEALYVGVAIVLSTVVIYRVQLLQRMRRDPAFVCYCIGIGLGVPYLLLRVPAIHTVVSRLVGVPNAAQPMALYLVVVACFLIRPLLQRLTNRAAPARPSPRAAALLLAAFASMAVVFLQIHVDDDSTWFTLRNEGAPFVLEYQIIYSFWTAVGLLAFGVPSWRYGRLSSDPSVRIGFGVLSPLGIACGLAALCGDLAFGASVRYGIAYPAALDPIAVFSVFTLLGFAALCIGSTMPAWGHHVGVPAVDRWLERYVLYHRLYPLWFGLYAASPWIALVPPRSRVRDKVAFGDLEFRFYRRVVEILDGRLALREFTTAGVDDVARMVCKESGVPIEDWQYVTAAASLTIAARAKLRGEPSHTPALPAIPMSNEIDGEARALVHVARYYANVRLMSLINTRMQVRPAGSRV
jgi:hypothetical protein